jgi:hypothetical protein
MDTVSLIRNKHLYRIWFVDLIHSMIASPEYVEKVKQQVQRKEKYFDKLFAIGNIPPKSDIDLSSKLFLAHIEGFKLVYDQVTTLTDKYPEFAQFELTDPRVIRFVVDWSDFLAGQAAAACNSQSGDTMGMDDATKCVDALLEYDDFLGKLGKAQDKLDECLLENGAPPVVESSDNPFSPPPLVPCTALLMDVVNAENNVNAAWDRINQNC